MRRVMYVCYCECCGWEIQNYFPADPEADCPVCGSDIVCRRVEPTQEVVGA